MRLLTLQAIERFIWYLQERQLEDLDEKNYLEIDKAWSLLNQILTSMYIGMPRKPFSKLLREEYMKGWCGCGCYFEIQNNPGLDLS